MVKTIPAFTAPITNWFDPPKLVTDPSVTRCMGYSQVAQDILKSNVPYIFWQGPFESDLGQVSQGFCGVGKVDFWFHCCHEYMTNATQWASDIQEAVAAYFVANQFCVLDHYRITAALFKDRKPVEEDQTIRTAEEFPKSRCMIGYTFGYQLSGN